MSGEGHPHNVFVQQIGEVGIFGGIVYAALWATALSAGWQVTTRGMAPGGRSVFYGLIAITVANLGENNDIVARPHYSRRTLRAPLLRREVSVNYLK